MNFYRRRPLALIVTICVLAAAAVYFLSAPLKITFIVLTALSAPIIVSLLKRLGVKSVCNLSATPFVIISAAFIMVLALISLAYFNVHAARYDDLAQGGVRATVTSVESRTAYGAVYEVRMSLCDGKGERAKGLVSTDSTVQLNIGDVIEADVEFCAPEDFYSYRDTSRLELVADGIVFTANTVGEIRLCGEDSGILTLLAKLRELFGAKISLYLDKESAPLADALFLGKREGLGKTERDFKYAGVMHLLALSGLHLSIITGGFERFLMRLGVGAKVRSTLTILLAAFYVALTGFISSAMRAAIMLAITYAASLIDTDSDRITSLFTAVGLIVLADPTAVFDVSLQLSFAATLGLLLVAEPANHLSKKLVPSKASRPLLRVLIRTARSIAASLGAIMFVLPLQWIYFGEASLISAVATLVITPICEVLLVLIPPLLVCSLLGWSFVCTLIGGAIRAVSLLCTDTAATLSKSSALVSLGYPFVLPIMIICAVAIIYMAVRGCRSWLYALIPFAVSVTVFVGCVRIYDVVYDGRVSVDITGGASGEAITLISKRSAAVIFIGDGSSQTVYPTVDFLSKRNLTEIETVILTSISRRQVNSVRKLLNCRKVGTVFIPIPNDEYNAYLCADIAELAREYGSRLVFYDRANDSSLTHGSVTVNIARAAWLSRSTSVLTALTFESDDSVAAYVGASAWEDAEIWELVSGAEYIIFGSCGPAVGCAPNDTVHGTAEAIYVPDGSFAAMLEPWLDGFGNVILSCGRLSFVLEE